MPSPISDKNFDDSKSSKRKVVIADEFSFYSNAFLAKRTKFHYEYSTVVFCLSEIVKAGSY